MDLYAENILDHYRSPRHKTSVSNADIVHNEKNVSCGDTLTISLKMDGDTITDIGWDGQGCAISQAAMSILSEELINMSVGDIEHLTTKDIIAMLGVPIGARRMKCALLSLHAIKNALRLYAGEPEQSWPETLETK